MVDADDNRIPVIIDTDIGSDIDDTWALAMALGCPELDIKLIITCTGDTEYRAKIVCKFLQQAGRTDIPVAVGIPFDEGKNRETQLGYVKDYSLDDFPGTVRRDGINALAETISTTEQQIALVCIGPLPNIAELLRVAPDVIHQARFVGMHGSVYKGYFGTEKIHAEFNVQQHLASAQRVLASGFDITITPLDTCGVIRLVDDHYQRSIAGNGKAMAAVLENYRIWLNSSGKGEEASLWKSSVLFDTVAIYLAFSEGLLDMETLTISVSDEGKTVIDPNGKPMRVATAWIDLAAFYDLLVDRLLAAG